MGGVNEFSGYYPIFVFVEGFEAVKNGHSWKDVHTVEEKSFAYLG